jgi:hypothetical protein
MYSTDFRKIMPLFALTTPASIGVDGSSGASFLAGTDVAESDSAALLELNNSSVAVGLETGAG